MTTANAFADFADSLANEPLIAAPARKADAEKFPCQQCAGSGLWTARRVNRHGNDKCNACNGRGHFVTSPAQRLKARAQVAGRKARNATAGREAFEAAHPRLAEFLASAGRWSAFAASMGEQIAKKGSLSDKQISAARSMQAKCAAREDARTAEREQAKTTVDLGAIREMFDAAVANGKAKPTYRAEGLVISRAPDHGRNAGALYVKAAGEYQGKLIGVEFNPVRSVETTTAPALAVIAANPLQAAVRFGRKEGKCSCCGRKLTKGTSIAAGIGPICAENFGF
jgi:Family of unknown function (DUF6011)